MTYDALDSFPIFSRPGELFLLPETSQMQRIVAYKPQRLLKICKRSSEIGQIHALMTKNGVYTIPFPLSKLIALCISIDFAYAQSIFASIGNPNVFMCSTMLRGHSMCERPEIGEVVKLFNSIRTNGMLLDQFSFIASLKSCTKRLAFQVGEQIHGVAIVSGFDRFLNLRNMLIAFYCSCGMVQRAQQVFDEVPYRRDAVAWSSLISGYLDICQYAKVLELFMVMRKDELEITPTVVLSVLLASSNFTCHNLGESLHGYCVKLGFSMDQNVASAMISMYGKFGSLDSAEKIFNESYPRDVVLWNCMVDAYAKCGGMEKSVALLQQMENEGVKPNSATFVCLLSACASSANLILGQHILRYVDDEIQRADAVLGTTLIDLYSKCGYIDKAIEIFNKMQNKDVKSWTAMITGLGLNGWPKCALELFSKMQEEGVKPNDVTFLAVISACCHGGLVVAGKEYFRKMIEEFHILPSTEHYGCLVDLFGRSGLLHEAQELIKCLRIDKDPMAWRALLSACRVSGNVDLSDLARKHLVELGDDHHTDLILHSSTYAAAGRLPDAAALRDAQSEKLSKEVGWSSVEVDCKS